ncbi:DUF4189 domain-containing protein [Synechococcales cyanobacterium C]|uniref:DUF4189 domain-containing protein n=1 Tax=Petrachloros mirabilis ULC683 TaxID=2781853 RepID=A0A8K2A7B2_9CYAN|nr:DUF4189 domain-containing protein [Petrachloros mirabilis]NCJ05795.1 DUF4189 domain-containing protein [Petrachloros mirabilis ULC683]
MFTSEHFIQAGIVATTLTLGSFSPMFPGFAQQTQAFKTETAEIITDTLQISAVAPMFESDTSHVFGAIAYSPSTQTQSSAVAWIPEAAAGEALHQCQLQSRAQDCVVKLQYKDGWGALAVSANGVYGIGLGYVEQDLTQAKDQAHNQALQTCQQSGGKNCRILSSRAAIPDTPTLDLSIN